MGGTSSITSTSPNNLLIPSLPAAFNPVHTPLPNIKPNRHSNSHDLRTSSIKIPTHRKGALSIDNITRIDIREPHPILLPKPSSNTLHHTVYNQNSTYGTISPSFRSLKPILSPSETSLFSYSKPPSHNSYKVSPSNSPSPGVSTYKLITSRKSSPNRPKVKFACPEGEASNPSYSKIRINIKVMRYKKK